MAKAAAPDPQRHLPLSPQTFHILLALREGPRHGYAMITEIHDRTDGEIDLTASTLYDALARLLDRDMLAETDSPPGAADTDARRRYYALTPFGRAVAEAEARRLERLVALARGKRLARARR